MRKGDELNNLANKDNQNQQKLSENDEYVLSEWQAPKNKTGFFIFLVSSTLSPFKLSNFLSKSDLFPCLRHCVFSSKPTNQRIQCPLRCSLPEAESI